MKRILAMAAVLALAVPNLTFAAENRAERADRILNGQQNNDNQGNRGNQGRQGGGGQGRPVPQATNPTPPQQQRGGTFDRNNAGPAYANPRDLAPQGSVNAQGNQNNRGNNNNRFDNNNRGGNDNNNRFGNNNRGNDNRFGNNNNDRRFDNNNNRFDNNRRFDNNNNRFGNDNRFDNRRFDNDRRFGDNRNVGRYFGGYERFAGRNFRFHGRAFTAFRGPAFVYPRGYSYRRWSIGAFLPSLFLSNTYFVDWDYLGLPPPEVGTEWVRYGPDALLVDQYNGEVIDVAYGVFY